MPQLLSRVETPDENFRRWESDMMSPSLGGSFSPSCQRDSDIYWQLAETATGKLLWRSLASFGGFFIVNPGGMHSVIWEKPNMPQFHLHSWRVKFQSSMKKLDIFCWIICYCQFICLHLELIISDNLCLHEDYVLCSEGTECPSS